MLALLAHLATGREVGVTSCPQGAAGLACAQRRGGRLACPNQEELVALGSGMEAWLWRVQVCVQL